MSLVPKLSTFVRAGAGTLSRVLPRHMSSLTAQKLSTVHVGTAFEERSCILLRQTMSMALTRVGGKDDEGVDLLGWWWLPNALETNNDASIPSTSSNIGVTTTTSTTSTTTDASPLVPTSQILSQSRSRIRILAQCKAESKKMGPAYVRELEGVLFRSLASDPAPLVGLLISQSAFTKAAVLRAQSSPIPMLLLHLPVADGESFPAVDSESSGTVKKTKAEVKKSEVKKSEVKKSEVKKRKEEGTGDDPGAFGGALCNPALMRMRNVRGRMEIRWERRLRGMGGRPALWWDGLRLSSQIPTPDPIPETGETSGSATEALPPA